ncbi:hypothetical protein Dimus_036339 [Dionaea muscipula]
MWSFDSFKHRDLRVRSVVERAMREGLGSEVGLTSKLELTQPDLSHGGDYLEPLSVQLTAIGEGSKPLEPDFMVDDVGRGVQLSPTTVVDFQPAAARGRGCKNVQGSSLAFDIFSDYDAAQDKGGSSVSPRIVLSASTLSPGAARLVAEEGRTLLVGGEAVRPQPIDGVRRLPLLMVSRVPAVMEGLCLANEGAMKGVGCPDGEGAVLALVERRSNEGQHDEASMEVAESLPVLKIANSCIEGCSKGILASVGDQQKLSSVPEVVVGAQKSCGQPFRGVANPGHGSNACGQQDYVLIVGGVAWPCVDLVSWHRRPGFVDRNQRIGSGFFHCVALGSRKLIG